MQITLPSVLTIILFLLPGYLVYWTRRKIAIIKEPSQTEFIIQTIALSALLYVFVAIVAHWVGVFDQAVKYILDVSAFNPVLPPLDAAIWLVAALLIVLVISFIVGILSGLTQKWCWIERIFARLKMSTLHPYNSEWDNLFSKEVGWVQVNGKSGAIYRGYCRSITSYPSQREIILSNVSIDQQGNDDKEPTTLDSYQLVWIGESEIESIFAQVHKLECIEIDVPATPVPPEGDPPMRVN